MTDSCITVLQPADIPMLPHDLESANEPTGEAECNDNTLHDDPPAIDEECESMDSTNSNDGESASMKTDSTQLQTQTTQTSQTPYPVVYPAYFSPVYPFPMPYWSGYMAEPSKKEETHEVLKPTAVHSKSPINVDELVGMSKLSLGDSIGDSGPSSLSLKLLQGPSRQSAFHATPACGDSDVNGSVIHAL